MNVTGLLLSECAMVFALTEQCRPQHPKSDTYTIRSYQMCLKASLDCQSSPCQLRVTQVHRRPALGGQAPLCYSEECSMHRLIRHTATAPLQASVYRLKSTTALFKEACSVSEVATDGFTYIRIAIAPAGEPGVPLQSYSILCSMTKLCLSQSCVLVGDPQ